MREAKFRYWDSFNAEMLYSDGIGLENFFRCYQMAKNFDNNPILMQFTGEKDKDGKDIYEGDVLRILGNIGYLSVEFAQSGFVSCFPYSPQIRQIVGNIYESPELLKATT